MPDLFRWAHDQFGWAGTLGGGLLLLLAAFVLLSWWQDRGRRR
jgi:hypothetical protein